MGREYFAFISYKSEDVEWAIWLQHELEHYHLPASFNGRTDIRHELRPVFRDIDELSAGNLPEQIQKALANSQNLIVICSPNSRASHWVNEEVKSFISLGKTDHIYPFIIEGRSPSEYFPEALLNLPKNEERLGGDVTKNGRDAAFIKVVSGMLGLGFDSLWNRYEREKAEEERKQREQRDNLLRSQSRLISEKAAVIAQKDSHTALKLLTSVLPEKLETPDRPYTAEAEKVLRSVIRNPNYVFRGHEESVNHIALSPVNLTIASVSDDNTLRLWDILSGKQIWSKDAKCAGGTVSFNSDGSRIASNSWDGHINVWDPSTGDLLRSTHYDYSTPECFSFLNDRILIIVDSEKQHIAILDVETGDIEFTKLINKFESAALSSDGKVVVFETEDRNGDTFVEVYEIQFHIPFIINKENLTLKYISRFPVEESISSLAVDANQMIVAINSQFEKTISLYDYSSKDESVISQLLHNNDTDYVCFSDDGNVLVASGNSVYEWNTMGFCFRTIEGHTDQINIIVTSKDGKYVATAGCDGTVRIWGDPRDTTMKKFSDINVNEYYDEPDKVLVNIHNIDYVATGLAAELADDSDIFASILSQDGSLKVYKSEDGHLIVSECSSGKRLLDIATGSERLLSFDISYDNVLVAASFSDDSVRVWEVRSGQCLHVLNGHDSYVNSVAFNHNNDKLVSTSEDEKVKVWDLKTGTLVKEISVYHEKEFVINHDRRFHSSYIGEGDEEYAAQAAVFSLDDRYIITGHGDGVLRIWDYESGICISEISAHGEEITNVFISADGRKIITESSDGDSKIWDFIPLQELLDAVRERLKDVPLSEEQRKYYYLH